MKDFFRYTGKVCVVTGSSNGMGLATAKMLVELGARVYALSRSETKVDGLAASILCDLTKKDDIDRAFAQLPERIDCFFGVAGLSGAKTDYVTTFNCDFTANKYITLKYLVNRMDAGSSITYVASTAGQAWQTFMGEQNEVVHAEGWEGTVAALGDVPELAPSNFAYMFAKRCICQFAAEQAVELGKTSLRCWLAAKKHCWPKPVPPTVWPPRRKWQAPSCFWVLSSAPLSPAWTSPWILLIPP